MNDGTFKVSLRIQCTTFQFSSGSVKELIDLVHPCKAVNNLRSSESGISQGTYYGLIEADMPLSSSMFDL